MNRNMHYIRVLKEMLFSSKKKETTSAENWDGEWMKVAAGNPAQEGCVESLEHDNFPDGLRLPDGNRINTSDYKKFIVDGDSMAPKDIWSGDVLLCTSVECNGESDFKKDKMVVIQVDKAYYKHKEKELKFNYKLRNTLTYVPKDFSADDLIEKLKRINEDIYLPENQESLKEDLDETRKFYSQVDLALSITYRKGKLHYSFHPANLIKFVGVYAARCEKGVWLPRKI